MVYNTFWQILLHQRYYKFKYNQLTFPKSCRTTRSFSIIRKNNQGNQWLVQHEVCSTNFKRPYLCWSHYSRYINSVGVRNIIQDLLFPLTHNQWTKKATFFLFCTDVLKCSKINEWRKEKREQIVRGIISILFYFLTLTFTIAGLRRNLAPEFMACFASLRCKIVPTCTIKQLSVLETQRIEEFHAKMKKQTAFRRQLSSSLNT